MEADYLQLIGYLLLGIGIAVLPLVIPLVISPTYKGPQTRKTYECGIDTVGPAWMRFSISFYLFALIFVAFEVDILYLFPVALVFSDDVYGWQAFVELAMFLGILSLAIVYAWRKGVLQWTK